MAVVELNKIVLSKFFFFVVVVVVVFLFFFFFPKLVEVTARVSTFVLMTFTFSLGHQVPQMTKVERELLKAGQFIRLSFREL